jgi:hypothetical protein
MRCDRPLRALIGISAPSSCAARGSSTRSRSRMCAPQPKGLAGAHQASCQTNAQRNNRPKTRPQAEPNGADRTHRRPRASSVSLETVLSAAHAGMLSRLALLVSLAAARPSFVGAARSARTALARPQPRHTADGCVCLLAERRAGAVSTHDRMGPGRPLLQRCTDVATYTMRPASPRASPMRVSSA